MRLNYRVKQLLLATGDLLSFVIGFYISLAVRYWALPDWVLIDQHSTLFSILFLLWIVFNYINGLYDLERNTNDSKFYRRFAETTGLSLLLSVAFFYLLPERNIAPKTILLLNVVFGYGLSVLWRFGYHHIVGTKALKTNVIMVGYSPETQQLIDILKNKPEKGYKVTALIDPEKKIQSRDLEGIDVYHGLHTIRPVTTNNKGHLVVVASHLHRDPEALKELYELLFWSVNITDLTSFYEIVTGRIPPSTFSEGWFLQHLRRTEQPIYDRFRTLADYLVGIIGMTILGILFLPIAVLIKTSKGPIFIKQKRVGQGGEFFTLYKFRSMYALSKDGSAEVDGVQFAKKDDVRITKVGKFLRRSRLDELPQVWNLLKRNITLIGPRPERPEIVSELESRMPYYPLRHVVRPGLTGWALIHQNYTDDYDKSLQKLQYDLYYIKNRSIVLDLVILLRTVNVLIRLMGQ